MYLSSFFVVCPMRRYTMRVYMVIMVLAACVLYNVASALPPTDVTDMVIKLPSREEKVFEYKFAAGDTIILNASVAGGSDISEIVVEEWPSTIRFQASDVEIVESKRIVVPRTSIYYFRIKNKAIFKTQTYNIQIQRIPSDEKFIMFNTSAEWDTIYDTSYVAVVESVLIRIDTTVEDIIKTVPKLGSQMTGNTRTYITITLPTGTAYWAYWIGVGQEAAAGLEQMGKSLPEGAALLGLTNPVALFAVGLLPQLFSLNQGQDIYYCFIADNTNLQLFMAGQSAYVIRQGKIITDYARMEQPKQGTFFLGLSNAHSDFTSKIVNVNVVAVKIVPTYSCKEIQKPVINARIVPKI
jgi:hypothetical protein